MVKIQYKFKSKLHKFFKQTTRFIEYNANATTSTLKKNKHFNIPTHIRCYG